MSAKNMAPTAFLNGPNYQKIVGFLRQQYAARLGTQSLPERVDSRIQKTVQHYMTEVSRIQGNKPVQALTQEVLREATGSIDLWMKKQEAPQTPITTIGAHPLPQIDVMNRLYEDTGSAYERVMSERAPPAIPTPSLPDFRTPADMIESSEDPVLLMQRMQKQRDDQARAIAKASESLPVAAGPRLEIREESSSAIPPQATPAPPLLAPRPQDYIIPQEDVVKYKQTEFNLFVTSSDRDWLRNTKENRYNFSVLFNAQDRRTGFGYNVAVQQRLRNIQAIEFVKAILPVESLTTLVRLTDGTPTFDNSRVVNVFALPCVGVQIDELENNGFSSKPDDNKTFAVLQYDSTWSSDLSAPERYSGAPANILTKSGYTGFIPKFLKCQKVYSPTPLSTLNRLSFRLERHAGNLLSDDPDVFFIRRVCMSNAFTSIGTDSTIYNSSPVLNSYVFLNTNKYFPYSAVSEGDNILIQGMVPREPTDPSLIPGMKDFELWLNRADGHYVIATGYVDPVTGALRDGRNDAGYCNVIILRNRFNDPTTGSVGRDSAYFGGSVGAETTISDILDDTNEQPDFTGGGCLNLSRQTHIVLRIVTRDMDASSNIRPDNV
jgi:hypothetical protein